MQKVLELTEDGSKSRAEKIPKTNGNDLYYKKKIKADMHTIRFNKKIKKIKKIEVVSKFNFWPPTENQEVKDKGGDQQMLLSVLC